MWYDADRQRDWMFNRVEMRHFGPVRQLDWVGLGQINVLTGINDSGKTFILKALYAAMRTIREAGQGNDPRSAEEVLSDKLYWTFQPENGLKALVAKGENRLQFDLYFEEGARLHFGFGRDTTRQISHFSCDIDPERFGSVVFLPAKEVLSLFHVIRSSREHDQVFGFDDTYYDLVRALQKPTSKGNLTDGFKPVRQALEAFLGGHVFQDGETGQWLFRKGRQSHGIHLTAEGIRKIGILDTLLGNRYLKRWSVILIDEPESALHPEGIVMLMDCLKTLVEKAEMQIFISTHSYFVLKKLYLMALETGWSIPCASFEEGMWRFSDLKQGMSDNPIVRQSVSLYEQEMEHLWA